MADTTPITSKGLMGLPHFRSSRISTELYEPVYLNLFTVNIQLPTLLANTLVPNEDLNLLLEGVTKVGGLDTNKVPDAGAEQHYKFASRRFANSGPAETTIDITLDFEVNVRGSATGAPDMFTVKILRMWDDLIYDPLTGAQHIKAEYVAPQMDITMHDKKGQPFWVWHCYHVFPKAKLTPPDLDYMKKNELYKVAGYTLACDSWEEAML